MKQWLKKIHYGDVLNILKKLPDESVDSIVTSPPYYGLRDYGVNGQVGLEKTLAEYLEKMLAITAELKRVLKPTGTMWWNHGDSYSQKQVGAGGGWAAENAKDYPNPPAQYRSKFATRTTEYGIPEKSLALQNYRLAQRMVDEQGWILRNIIVWHKPNCMPSSVKDRFTVDYEPVFFFTKAKKYWFEPQYDPMDMSKWGMNKNGNYYGQGIKDYAKARAQNPSDTKRRIIKNALLRGGRNKRSVWRIPTKPFPEAHFAVFPPALIETPIKAGCPEMICKKCGKAREKIFNKEYTTSPGQPPPFTKQQGKKFLGKHKGEAKYPTRYEVNHVPIGYTDCGCAAGWEPGIVLDPFMGAGTTALVAEKLGRSWIGIELKQEYIEIAKKRLRQIGELKKQRSCFQQEVLAL